MPFQKGNKLASVPDADRRYKVLQTRVTIDTSDRITALAKAGNTNVSDYLNNLVVKHLARKKK